MTFENLPDDWPLRPLTEEPFVHDVLDLVVSCADRANGGLAVLMCDAQGRLRQPCFVAEVPDLPTPEECRRALEPFVALLEAGPGQGSLLLAIARAEHPTPTSLDRRWHQAAVDVCHGRLELLGVHVVTMTGAVSVPGASRAA